VNNQPKQIIQFHLNKPTKPNKQRIVNPQHGQIQFDKNTTTEQNKLSNIESGNVSSSKRKRFVETHLRTREEACVRSDKQEEWVIKPIKPVGYQHSESSNLNAYSSKMSAPYQNLDDA